MALHCGEKYSGEGKKYHFPFDINAVWKKMNWGREEVGGNFGEENQDLNK